MSSEELFLKDAFSTKFKFGFAVNDAIVANERPELTDIVLRHANTITLENSMKAEVISPAPGIFNFAPGDAFVQFGKDNNMFVIGHTLVWHNQTPPWFFNDENGEPNSSAEQLSIMDGYIKRVAGHYAGKVDAWDVVNEIIDDDGNYRETIWVDRLGSGEAVVRAAFSLAEIYLPDTELYYNDFNAWRPEKRDGIIRMIKMLQKNNIRIDGIGIQGHWGLNYPDLALIDEAIDLYADLGIKVMITELDIDVLPITKEGQIIGQGLMDSRFELPEFERALDPYKNGLPEEVQQALTARYGELFELFIEKQDKLDRVTLWGVDDSMSWKNTYPIPNRVNYPLLWNRDLTPKEAVSRIAELSNKE
ncbi:endo-1,4-beta-xylanase [Alteromonas oceanisediminis]|uniref:endo-1,4-beta-xylanase n=1 Tax=Alteromonas oceanisediminis TaxID=2836180 RepID=UPI0028F437CB|nr:endo-1,4-beta-xylanase [Alteromonas oceanisediminis]